MRFFPQLISVLLASILAAGPVSASPAESSDDVAGAARATQLEIHVLRGDSNAAAVGSVAKSAIVVEVTDATGAKIEDAAVAFRLPDSGASGTFADGSRAAVAYTDKSGQASPSDIHWGNSAGTVPIRVTASKGSLHAGVVVEQTLMAAGASAAPVKQALPSPPAVQISTPEAAATVLQQPGVPSVPTVNVPPPTATHATPSPASTSSSEEPRVTIASDSQASKHGGKGKWIAILAVAAGAAAGVGMVGHGKSKSTSSAPALTVGTPTISVGSH